MIMRFLLGVLLLLSLTGNAEARHHAHPFSHHGHSFVYNSVDYNRHKESYVRDGRPNAWCGWQMRQWFGGGSEYNLARNWAYRGVSVNAQVGAVVVWPHHVGYITGYDSSKHLWIVKSGNDGHRVRERPRSINAAIAIRSI